MGDISETALHAPAQAEPVVRVSGVCKSFTMHLRDGAELDVVRDVSFDVAPGECVVLGGPSGTGKSSILKMIYGNYRTDTGRIEIVSPFGTIDVASASPRQILKLRDTTLGYVSQFLRCIPRVSALDIVAAAARTAAFGSEASDHRAPTAAPVAGRPPAPTITEAQAIAQALLAKLNLPDKLWDLPPATFSGGEQQRVNIAVGFASQRPVLLLDEPTASLDAVNRQVVVELVQARKQAGAAIIGIFHDAEVRAAVADRTVDIAQFAA